MRQVLNEYRLSDVQHKRVTYSVKNRANKQQAFKQNIVIETSAMTCFDDQTKLMSFSDERINYQYREN